MRKSFVWLMAVVGMALALASCSKDSDNGIDTPNVEEKVEIMAKSKALTLDVTTKAPFEGTIGSSNNLTARVLVSKATGDYGSTNIHANGTMTFTDQTNEVAFATSGFSGNKFFPGNDDIFLVGLYPTATWGTLGTTTTYTIDGKSDLMVAPQVSTQKGDSNGAPVLAFKHLLTKLNIKVVASDTDAAAAWGEITDMSLTKAEGNAINTVATVTLAAGTATFGTTGSIPCYKAGTSTYSDDAVTTLASGSRLAISTSETRVAYSLVTPIALSGTTPLTNAYELALKTTTSGSTALAVPISITSTVSDITNTAGYAFDITLTFSGTEIKAKATVTAWQDGGTGTGTIQ